VKFALQRFRYAATGRWAVSIRTYTPIVMPFGFLTSVEREQSFNGTSITQAVVISVGGELVCALYLFIMQTALLGNRYQRLQSLWRCLIVWFGAGFVRGFFTACNANWNFGYDFNFLNRIIPSMIFTGSAMALVAFFFGSIERKRIEIKALSSLDHILQTDQESLIETEAQQKILAQQVYQSQIMPQIKSLQLGISELLKDPQNQTETRSLTTLYEQSVEVGNSLQFQKVNIKNQQSLNLNSNKDQNPISYWSALLPKTLSVRITFVVLLLGSFAGQYSRNGIEGVKAGFVGAVIVTAYIFPLAQIVKRNVRFKSVAYFLGYVGAFVLQAVYNVIQPKLLIVLDNPYAPWYSAIKTTYGLYLASVIASMLVLVQGSFKSLIESGAQLEKNVELLQLENLALEQSITESQFGTLQGKIAGVSMALHLMGTMESIDQRRKTELLSSASVLLNESLNALQIMKEVKP
jgi:hypothetical protein